MLSGVMQEWQATPTAVTALARRQSSRKMERRRPADGITMSAEKARATTCQQAGRRCRYLRVLR